MPWAKLQSKGEIDTAASDASRIFYLPARASKDAPFEFAELSGALLDWRSLDLQNVHKRDDKSRVVEAAALVLKPKASPDFEKFEMLCEVEPKFKRSWERKRSDFKDQSASSYDLSLANFAVAAGWSDQEIANLIIAWRRKHGESLKLRQDYYQSTIANARKETTRDEVILAVESGEASSREEKLDKLSTVLTVQFRFFKCQLTQPRTYVMGIGSYDIEFPNQAAWSEQSKFAGAMRDYAHIEPPHFKPKEWVNIRRLLLAVVEDVENSEDATYLGECEAWLRDHLLKMRPEMDQINAIADDRAAKLKDGVYFSLKGLLRSIRIETHDQPPTKGILSGRLRQLGCIPKPRYSLYSAEAEIRTTKTLWRAPDEIASEILAEVEERRNSSL